MSNIQNTIIIIIFGSVLFSGSTFTYGKEYQNSTFQEYVTSEKIQEFIESQNIPKICGFDSEFILELYIISEIGYKPYKNYTQEEKDLIYCFEEQTGFDADRFMNSTDNTLVEVYENYSGDKIVMTVENTTEGGWEGSIVFLTNGTKSEWEETIAISSK